MTPPLRPFQSIDIPPFWKIRGPDQPASDGGIPILLQPGPGFGNGAHETTQLCLQAIAYMAPRGEGGFRMLDFGSGSGILSIGAARLGATVAGVEIDERALAHADENIRINGVADRIRNARALEEAPGPFEVIVGNILRQVLLHFAPALVTRLAPGGTLVLSGLVSTDVPEIIACYTPLLGDRRPEIYERGNWRALVWRTAASP
jgi:ribosomal protein L11 methyltransferase